MKTILKLLAAFTVFAPSTVLALDKVVFIDSAANDRIVEDYARCLQAEISKSGSNIEILQDRYFKDQLFPFFEPNTIPESVHEMSLLLDDPRVRHRIKDLGVRFVVTKLSESTYSSEHGMVWGNELKGDLSKGFMLCSYNGCLGGVAVEKTTNASLYIWDLENLENSNGTDISINGKDFWLGFALPIYLPSATTRTACRMVGKEVLNFIQGVSATDPG